MDSINLSYSDFIKTAGTIAYAQLHGNYYLFSTVGDLSYTCTVSDDLSQADFEANYKSTATSLIKSS